MYSAHCAGVREDGFFWEKEFQATAIDYVYFMHMFTHTYFHIFIYIYIYTYMYVSYIYIYIFVYMCPFALHVRARASV